jgi:hypothetical protein
MSSNPEAKAHRNRMEGLIRAMTNVWRHATIHGIEARLVRKVLNEARVSLSFTVEHDCELGRW